MKRLLEERLGMKRSEYPVLAGVTLLGVVLYASLAANEKEFSTFVLLLECGRSGVLKKVSPETKLLRVLLSEKLLGEAVDPKTES